MAAPPDRVAESTVRGGERNRLGDGESAGQVGRDSPGRGRGRDGEAAREGWWLLFALGGLTATARREAEREEMKREG
ncbi:hypothetical protein SSP531S_48870 [Streptomyces spongiicola]|uniref:Uncharacterized protein n=1 Tax=Streptomyces spongiicola TaxID=1690221 RepID=A0A388T3A7_9ACTN|nr:hypothetical protein SSP531S_48870 [Streptomyces spongiicola]